MLEEGLLNNNLKLTILGILAVVSIGIYLVPEKKEEVPTRVLLENLGGKVIFSHKMHAENYGFDCADCHHESSNPAESVLACGVCHGTIPTNAELAEISKEGGDGKTPLGDMPYHNTDLVKDKNACLTCHHLEFTQKDWGHDRHSEEFGLDCESCHHSDKDIEPEPMNCNNCHNEDSAVTLKKAVHTKCMECHQDWFDKDTKLDSCSKCHDEVDTRKVLKEKGSFEMNPVYAKCSSCHGTQEPQELVQNRMAAFHELCMGCHESVGAGPYKSDECAQCHTK